MELNQEDDQLQEVAVIEVIEEASRCCEAGRHTNGGASTGAATQSSAADDASMHGRHAIGVAFSEATFGVGAAGEAREQDETMTKATDAATDRNKRKTFTLGPKGTMNWADTIKQMLIGVMNVAPGHAQQLVEEVSQLDCPEEELKKKLSKKPYLIGFIKHRYREAELGFECDICGAGFEMNYNMTKHKKNMHVLAPCP